MVYGFTLYGIFGSFCFIKKVIMQVRQINDSKHRLYRFPSNTYLLHLGVLESMLTLFKDLCLGCILKIPMKFEHSFLAGSRL